MGQPGSKSSGESIDVYKEIDNYQKNGERRIILIGKTGTGKSTLGNAILGDRIFKNEGVQMHSNTTHCQFGRKKKKNGKEILVLDTPGLMDTKRKEEEIIEELCKCTAIMAPGPHAFCLVIRGDDRFTQENIDTLDKFCAFFGEEIYKYVIVVFTHKASMGKSATTDDCLSALPAEFLTKFLQCGGKKIAIESTAEKKELKKQINELFKLIEDIIEKNDGVYYSEKKFRAAEEAFRKRIPEIQKKVEKQYEEKKTLLEDEYQKNAKRLEEGENKLREEKVRLMQEQQLKESEKLEKDTFLAQMKKSDAKHQEEIKSLEEKLEKERKEIEKIKEDFDRNMEKINRKVKQEVCNAVIENRSNEREAVRESTVFRDVARSIVSAGAGFAYDAVAAGTEFAYDAVAGGIQKAIGVIGTIGRLIW